MLQTKCSCVFKSDAVFTTFPQQLRNKSGYPGTTVDAVAERRPMNVERCPVRLRPSVRRTLPLRLYGMVAQVFVNRNLSHRGTPRNIRVGSEVNNRSGKANVARPGQDQQDVARPIRIKSIFVPVRQHNKELCSSSSGSPDEVYNPGDDRRVMYYYHR